MTSGQTRVSDRAVHLQVCAARQIRRVGLRAAAVHGKDGRRHRDHPEHAYGRDQSRTRDHFLPDRLHDRRPAVSRVMAELWTGQHE